jgi:uncharacterized membrane protein YqiK
MTPETVAQVTPASFIADYWWLGVLILVLLLGIVFFKSLLRLFGVVLIPDDSLGVVNKKFVLFGSNKTLPDGTIIALRGEAGIQADTLAPGVHFCYWPWQYEIYTQKFITIPSNSVGIVEARDGQPIPNGRVLANNVPCDMFQNARQFLENKGQRGSQINVMPPGTYRINTGLFTVKIAAATKIEDNMVGIVTTKEGQPLPTGEIAGREIAGHNLYQDGQTFLNNGGFKGRQEQVILAGTYYLNPLFVEVQSVPLTEVPIAHAGVVIAFIGMEGQDVTGDAFKHGNLCRKGEKGVWVEPLDPGKYPINPYTHKVEMVPTANIVLNWATGKTESHMLDKELSTITVRSADGFTFNLDVSQIIHIPRTDAPKVIARFGTVKNLVTQVLEPIIGNYFRNTAQNSDVIEFLKARSQRQQEAKAAIQTALEAYNVNAVDTLIGDINPPEQLMKTLTDKKVAEQQKATFASQEEAAKMRQKMEQATALANTQAKVVDAERQVAIQEFTAAAAVKTAEGQATAMVKTAEGQATATVATAEGAAKSRTIAATAEAQAKKALADADAHVTNVTGEAEAGKTKAIGTAEAEVIQMKTDAMGQEKFAVVEVARALASAHVPLVPNIQAGGNSNGNGGTLVDVLLGNLILRQVETQELPPAPTTKPAAPTKA